MAETELDALIGKEQFTRIYLATKIIVYSVGDIPYFIDVEGRNNIVPTVQCLWRLPKLLRTFVIHAPVSEFVMNGADLMLPGLATVDGLEGVMRDEKMSIRVVGNPLPFAVGISNCSWEGILTNGRKGKALCVSSVYGDCLCPLKAAPNSGFGGSSIYALEGYEEASENSDDEDEEDDDEEGKTVGGVSYKKALKNKAGGGGCRIGGSSGIISSSDNRSSACAAAAALTAVVLPEGLEEWEDQEEWVVVEGGEVDAESGGIDKDEDDVVDEKDSDTIDQDEDNDDNEDEDEGNATSLTTSHEATSTSITPTTSTTPMQAMQAMDALMLTALLKAIKYVIKVSY